MNISGFTKKYVLMQTGCWVWTHALTRGGYGQMGWKGKIMKAHRISYELKYGEIPQGLDIDHLCRNRKCVNPAHLEAVSRKVNVLRGTGLAAINAKKTHCIRGHLFDKANTYYQKRTPTRTKRTCRTCARTKKRDRIND